MIRPVALAFVFALAMFAVSFAEPILAPAEPDGMKKIFNGKDLTGWDGDPRLWTVKDGVIRGETTKEKVAKGNTFLVWTEGKTKDFELRLSVRNGAVNNSGIQYRSQVDKNNKWRVRGYQHEIRNSNKLPNVSGFIYDEGGLAGGRGRTCHVGEKAVCGPDKKKEVTGTLITAEEYEKLFKVDEWNDVIIIAKGNRIQHYMNGRLVLDFTDNHPAALKEGVLALQLHAGAPMWVEFKDIRVREIK